MFDPQWSWLRAKSADRVLQLFSKVATAARKKLQIFPAIFALGKLYNYCHLQLMTCSSAFGQNFNGILLSLFGIQKKGSYIQNIIFSEFRSLLSTCTSICLEIRRTYKWINLFLHWPSKNIISEAEKNPNGVSFCLRKNPHLSKRLLIIKKNCLSVWFSRATGLTSTYSWPTVFLCNYRSSSIAAVPVSYTHLTLPTIYSV